MALWTMTLKPLDQSGAVFENDKSKMAADVEFGVCCKLSGTQKLIEEVRKCPWLYDMKRPDYHNLKKKQSSWQAIGNAMNSTPKDCATKWKGLRDRFTKELRHLSAKKDDDDGFVKRSTWPMMNKMAFLKPHVRRRYRIIFPNELPELAQEAEADTVISNGNEEGAEMDIGEVVQLGSVEEETQEQPLSPTRSTSPSGSDSSQGPSPTNKRATSAFEAELISTLKASRTALQPNAESSDRDKGDAEYHFAMYVAQRLRGLNGQQKSMLQAKIIELLHCTEYESFGT